MSASLAMSTSVLKAMPGKLDIKRRPPSILYNKVAEQNVQLHKFVCAFAFCMQQSLLFRIESELFCTIIFISLLKGLTNKPKSIASLA